MGYVVLFCLVVHCERILKLLALIRIVVSSFRHWLVLETEASKTLNRHLLLLEKIELWIFLLTCFVYIQMRVYQVVICVDY